MTDNGDGTVSFILNFNDDKGYPIIFDHVYSSAEEPVTKNKKIDCYAVIVSSRTQKINGRRRTCPVMELIAYS